MNAGQERRAGQALLAMHQLSRPVRRRQTSQVGPIIFFGTIMAGTALVAGGLLGAAYSPAGQAVRPSPTPVQASLTGRSPSPVASFGGSLSPSVSPVGRRPVDLAIISPARARAVFISEVTNVMCASSAVQMVVEILNGTTDTTANFQYRIRALIKKATVPTDSRYDGAGPAGMAAVISDLTGVPYELRSARTLAQALADAAGTMSRTGDPVVLMVWRGAHAWVMSGFRASADPGSFSDATVSGTYILDPWYPRISTIWGASDGPGVFQNGPEMVRNYLPWKRPDGAYPGRDGRFLYLAPVEGL